MDIKEIEEQIAQLTKIIDPLIEKRYRLCVELITLKSQFKVGDIIQWQAGSLTRTGRVIAIKNQHGRPMWAVTLIKKDGSDGSIINIRSFQNPCLATNPTPTLKTTAADN